MTTTGKATHTAGAMRAARKILSLRNECTTAVAIPYADLISRETGDLEMLEALEACADLFKKGHVIDHFNWAESSLSAENIQELNELPGQIKKAISKARGGR